MSLRAQTILILLAALAVAGFSFTLLTSFAIERMQRQQIAEIEHIYRQQIDQLARRIEDETAASRQEFSSFVAQGLFDIQARQILETSQDTVRIELSDLRTTSGTLIITNEAGRVTAAQMETADLPRTLHEGFQLLSRPIYLEGQRVGIVNLVLNSNRILERVRATSAQMRRSLESLTVIMLVVLVATCLLLWKVFRRQVRLLERNARLGQMAYVGQLAGGLAHEIRNPLHAMNINLQVAEEEIEDPRADSPAKVRSILRRLRGEVGELNLALTQFLEFARPERSAPEWVDLREVLGAVLSPARGRLEAIGGHLRLVVDPAFSGEANGGRAPLDTRARIQAASIRQAITNVVGNAVQALEERAADPARPAGWTPELVVHLGTARHGELFTLAIADNGPGIDVANLARIFDVFFSTRQGGSGFGLAISRRAFADHKGTITASSRPGAGATFTMTLPRDFEKP